MTTRHKVVTDSDEPRGALLQVLERNRSRTTDPALRARLGTAIGRLRLTPRQLAAIGDKIAARHGE